MIAEPEEWSSLKALSWERFKKVAAKEAHTALWRGVFPLGGVSLLIGKPASGKTALLAGLVAAMSGPGRLAGRKVEPGRIIYAHLEHQASELERLIEAACRGMNVSKPSVYIVRKLKIGGDADDLDDLAEVARKKEASAIFIDSFRASTAYDENNSQQVRDYGSRLRRLTDKGRRAVVVCHHAPWNAKHARGSTDFEAQADSWVHLTASGDGRTLDIVHHAGPGEKLRLRYNFHGSEDDGDLRLTIVPAEERPDVGHRIEVVIADRGPLTTRELRRAIRSTGIQCSQEQIKRALKTLVAKGRLVDEGTRERSSWILARSSRDHGKGRAGPLKRGGRRHAPRTPGAGEGDGR